MINRTGTAYLQMILRMQGDGSLIKNAQSMAGELLILREIVESYMDPTQGWNTTQKLLEEYRKKYLEVGDVGNV